MLWFSLLSCFPDVFPSSRPPRTVVLNLVLFFCWAFLKQGPCQQQACSNLRRLMKLFFVNNRKVVYQDDGGTQRPHNIIVPSCRHLPPTPLFLVHKYQNPSRHTNVSQIHFPTPTHHQLRSSVQTHSPSIPSVDICLSHCSARCPSLWYAHE